MVQFKCRLVLLLTGGDARRPDGVAVHQQITPHHDVLVAGGFGLAGIFDQVVPKGRNNAGFTGFSVK